MLRRLPIAFAALAALSACAMEEEHAGPKSDTFDGGVTVAIENPAATSLRQQVEANWNIPGGDNCHQPVVLRATVAADGTVRAVDPVGALPAGHQCDRVVESAIRALRVSSPLNFPPDNQPPTVDFTFRLPDWVH